MLKCQRCGGTLLEDYGDLACINCGAPHEAVACINCGAPHEAVAINAIAIKDASIEVSKAALIKALSASLSLFEAEYNQGITEEHWGPFDVYMELLIDWLDPEGLRTLINEWRTQIPKSKDSQFQHGILFALGMLRRFLKKIGDLEPPMEEEADAHG